MIKIIFQSMRLVDLLLCTLIVNMVMSIQSGYKFIQIESFDDHVLKRDAIRMQKVNSLYKKYPEFNDPRKMISSDDKATSNDLRTIKIYDQGGKVGGYSLNVYIGTPPQKQNVIIDTGSDDLIVYCNQCKECGTHKNSKFNQTLSSSIKDVESSQTFLNFTCRNEPMNSNKKCQFQVSYAQDPNQFLEGEYKIDKIQVGLMGDSIQKKGEKQKVFESTDFMFGCAQSAPSQFVKQSTDGIMGIRSPSNQEDRIPSLQDVLDQSNQTSLNQFSICFGDVGGYMTFGGFNSDKHTKGKEVQSFKYKDSQYASYIIKIVGLSIGEIGETNLIEEANQKKNYVLDSGTTLTYLPSDTYLSFLKNLDDYCDKGKDKCMKQQEIFYGKNRCTGFSGSYSNAKKILDSYPSIFLKLGSKGVPIEIKSSSYIGMITGNQRYDYAFCFMIQGSDNDILFFGNTFMKGYDILFKNHENVISFAESKCSSTKVPSFNEQSDFLLYILIFLVILFASFFILIVGVYMFNKFCRKKKGIRIGGRRIRSENDNYSIISGGK